ncbi:TolC family protein [Caulobacter sp. BK020]|uniref:TolC family protein n=1 Tax=Caulobacter sp. BK020 TaxID=2512117 RepID=UPI00104B09C6|nr:TolC family protein [Caulobacter sp. BK020]TCS04322.1 multidrug efflux system outer membrane protein [Caulobacter sp. BK020]
MIGRILAAVLAATPTVAGAAPQVAPPTSPPAWAATLDDPVLSDLLVRADQGSLDIRVALARLDKAQADVALARAERRPHLTIGAEAAVGGADFSSSSAGAGAPVAGSYEVDLFRRLKSRQGAAEADKVAAEHDVAAARQLVLAEVARTYVTLRADQEHRAAATVRAELARQAQDLLGRRASEGVILAEAVTTARTAQAQADADLQRAAHAVDADRWRLGLLLGQDAPIDEPAYGGDEIPATPLIATAESDAVLARPAIRAAYARLQAADARVAEAVAASRPRFTLMAGIGSGDPDLLYLLDVRALAWAIAGGLTHELLDGGAAKARKQGAEAEARLAELAYRKAVGQAWGQVRLDLAVLQDAAASESVAKKAWTRAVVAFGTGQTRHQDGDIDAMALAALEARAIEADVALTNAQAARAQAYVDLMLTLGGRAA